MEWLGDQGSEHKRYYSRYDHSGKELWIIFSHERHKTFFKELGDLFLKEYDIDIVVLWQSPYYACISIPPEQMMMDQSDLFIVDTSFLLKDESYLLHSIAGELSRRNGSYLFFAPNKKELERVEKELLKKDRGMYHMEEAFSIDREKSFIIPKWQNKKALESIFHQVLEVTTKFHKSKIFLCHASEDSKFTEKLAQMLSNKGIPVWYDEWALNVGDSIVEKISHGIKNSKFMGVVLSKNSVSKPWCIREMNSALQQQLSNKDIKILPIIIDDCDVPILFSDILWADFRNSFDEGILKLLSALRPDK